MSGGSQEAAVAGGPSIADVLEIFVHDIRSPLMAASGWVETAMRTHPQIDDERREELLQSALKSMARAIDLTQSLEALQRIRGSIVERRPETFDLVELLRTVWDRLEGSRERSAEFTSDSCVVRLDPGLFERVATEVLSNAVTHTPIETVVRITAQRLNGHAELTVVDDGPGVPTHLRERIFAPYDRGMAPITRGGFGLGLAVTRAIVEAHDGEAWIEDGPEGGTAFRLRVRAQDDGPSAVGASGLR